MSQPQKELNVAFSTITTKIHDILSVQTNDACAKFNVMFCSVLKVSMLMTGTRGHRGQTICPCYKNKRGLELCIARQCERKSEYHHKQENIWNNRHLPDPEVEVRENDKYCPPER